MHAIKRYLESIAPKLGTPVALADVDADDYDLVFYSGGHGPMEDLAYDAISGALLTQRLASGRPLALLCHAPAAILATADEQGMTPFAGRRMTGLSNREELLNSFARKAPWLLEDTLRASYGSGRAGTAASGVQPAAPPGRPRATIPTVASMSTFADRRLIRAVRLPSGVRRLRRTDVEAMQSFT